MAAAPDQTIRNGYPIGDVMRLVLKGDAYEVTQFDDAGELVDAPFYPARTLVVGPFAFSRPAEPMDSFCHIACADVR